MYTYLKSADDGLPLRESGSWAAEKLDYLRRYIDVFETSMREKWLLRNYVDLLAGPGKNLIRETGEILMGSPLLALTTKYPFTAYFFVDFEADTSQALRQRCSASPHADRVQVLTGDCNVEVETMPGCKPWATKKLSAMTKSATSRSCGMPRRTRRSIAFCLPANIR